MTTTATIEIKGVKDAHKTRYARFAETFAKFCKYRHLDVTSKTPLDFRNGEQPMQVVLYTVTHDRFGTELKTPVKGAMFVPYYSIISNRAETSTQILAFYKSAAKKIFTNSQYGAKELIVLVHERDSRLFEKLTPELKLMYDVVRVEYIPFSQLLSAPMEHSHSGSAEIISAKHADVTHTPVESFARLIKGSSVCDPIVTWLGAEVGDLIYMRMNITDASIIGKLVNTYYVDREKPTKKK
jgi:hypothetical protein